MVCWVLWRVLENLVGLLEHAARIVGVVVAQRPGARKALVRRIPTLRVFAFTNETVVVAPRALESGLLAKG